MAQYNWRSFLVAMVPEGFGEREEKPRSVRFPKRIAEGIEEVAGATSQEWAPAMFHLLQWALAEYKKQREDERKAAAVDAKRR